jgi:hypothetical protein
MHPVDTYSPDEVCDARDDAQGTEAGKIYNKKPRLTAGFKFSLRGITAVKLQ